MKIHFPSLLSFQYFIKEKAGKSGIFTLTVKAPNKRETTQILLVPLSTKNVEDTFFRYLIICTLGVKLFYKSHM